uniref:Protein kinase domain-containing protein n=1 Tax=Acrobeloides nanus TaxID=290746 RepID=A0A914CTS9_9BILA
MDSELGIELQDYLVKHDLNKLRFPNDPNEYNFSINDCDIYEIDILHKSSGNKMGFTRIFKPDKFEWEKILKEIELFKRMSKSPNVVDFYGFGVADYYGKVQNSDYLYICIELMDSTLFDEPPKTKLTYASQEGMR